jgi:hypothetical protein
MGYRTPAENPARRPARRRLGSSSQEPPRTTRRLQSSQTFALPSPGLLLLLPIQQSYVHSHTLPWTLWDYTLAPRAGASAISKINDLEKSGTQKPAT